MKLDENELKQRLKEQRDTVYLLFGDEPYLVHHYRNRIMDAVVPDDGLRDLNLHELDGHECGATGIMVAADTLPMMTEYSCVSVRDFSPAVGADELDRLTEWLADPPPQCVLIFWMSGSATGERKTERWKAFVDAIDKAGVIVEFPRKSQSEIVRMLVSGATRRGCTMQPSVANLLVDQCGDDLFMLLGELDKLAAIADGSEITADLVRRFATQQLEASVFELSKAIVQKQYERTYDLLRRLRFCREEPIAVLATLSNAYADMYRAKAAQNAGIPATALVKEFEYRGKDFRLKNAARNAAGISTDGLRKCLERLAETDAKMKSTGIDPWLLLEQTAAELILLVRQEGNGLR